MKGKGKLNNNFRDARKINDCLHMCSKPSNLGSKPAIAFRIHIPVMLTFLYLTWLRGTSGFNLDLTSSIEFDGPNNGSYYGYTVAMMNDKGRGIWILVGAPKDKSAYLPNVEKPGAIHKCTFTNDFSTRSCQELFVDDNDGKESSIFDGLFLIFKHGRDNQWLGASLDVQHGKGIVTCASRWFNKYFQNFFFMNGLCYEIPLDFNRKNIVTIPALVNMKKQSTVLPGSRFHKVNYGMGNLGGSVHYTIEGENLLIGAPGLRYFTGGFIDLRQTDAYITDSNKALTETNEMLGYAMTSGQYFGGETYFAVGAPRDHLTGKVYLFGANRNSFVLEEADMTLNGSETTKIPVNGYYGAALCSADVNKDGMDDLLIAAPFYSKGELDDTGVVFVYLGQADKRFKPMSTMLTGGDKAGARFGSAMASLGDMNNDTYNDIVVGAPYEDGLQGAIYVYNGCKTGVWPHYTQRISGANLRTGLMSFGISFSKSEDMDDDGVNDIAVGAYLSDKAYLLFGQSVININITVETSVVQIDKYTKEMCPSTNGSSIAPCFKVDVCFRYVYLKFNTIDVNVTVLLDTYIGDYNRIAWQSNGNSIKSFRLRLFSGDRSCIGQKDVLIKSTSDLVTPVRIKASYDVISIPSGNARVQSTVNKFDGENPDKQILIATKILNFKKDCPNNDCETDLHLTAEAVFGTSENFLILGLSNLTIDVSILKTGDPSYSSNFFISFPYTLQYQQVTKVYGDPEINCGFVSRGPDDSEEGYIESLDYLQRGNIPKVREDEFLLACSFGNPMYNDTGVRFQLSIVVPDPMNMTQLDFKLNANTLSTERKLADNVKTITVQVKNQVKTTFSGISKPTYITVRDEGHKYLTFHKYELRNQGPSPLPSSDLLFLYPQVKEDGKTYLNLNTRIHWDCDCSINCSFQDNIQPTYVIDKTGDEKIGESKTLADMKNTDCTKGGCSSYECKLYDIPARDSAVVTLEFVATGNILANTNDGEGLIVRSVAHVRLLEQDRLISDIKEHNIAVYTELLPVTLPTKRIQAPWWIFLLSVLAGLVIMALVVIILWKVGFFKRKQMEELKKMKDEVHVQREREKMLSVDGEVSGYKKVQKEGKHVLLVVGEVSGYKNVQKKGQTILPVDGELSGHKNVQKKGKKSLKVGGEVGGYKKGGTK